MSRIVELIKEKCPNGVEYKYLGHICNIKTGKGLTKKDCITDGKYAIISGGIEPLGYCNQYNREANTVTISRAGSAGYVNFIVNRFWVNDKCFSIIPNSSYKIKSKYLYYYLKNIEDSIMNLKSDGTVPTVNTEKISSIKVAIPPLEVQEEIVIILDKFTELESKLESELESELEARKNQYDFWCDKIFENASKKFDIVKFSSFASVQRGGSFQKKDYVDKGRPCIHYGQIYTSFNLYTNKSLTFVSDEVYKKQKLAQENDVIMAVTSENIEDVCKSVAWLGKEPIAVSGHSAIISSKQNPKYLSYFFQSSLFQEQKLKYARGVKVVEFSPSKLYNISIPLPTLEEQQRIVSILDKFNKLVNDISEKLPAEIELRRKQYEYYRNKLLSFKELGNE